MTKQADVHWGNREIDPFPANVVLASGYTMLHCALDGSMDGADRSGLYDFDTRVLSHHRLTLNGEPLRLLTSAILDECRWTGTLRLPRPGGTLEGPVLPQDSFELTIVRRVGCGMLEELELVNHSMAGATVELGVELDADFVEVIDLESARNKRGTTSRRFDDGGRAWHIEHDDEHSGRRVRRALRARVVVGPPFLVGTSKGFTATLALPPRGRAQLLIAYEPFVDGAWRSPLELGERALDETDRDRGRSQFRATRARIGPAGNVATEAFERGAEDLFSLRLWELEGAPTTSTNDANADASWIPAAGMPLYSGVFGRDVLTAGWQASLVTTDIARGAIDICARTQATKDDPFLDEEPGRMIHEMRRGPLSELGVIPQARYYGSQTTPAMFVVALSELWHWTGDIDVLRRYRDAALRTFEWAERYGDLDGDGLLEYRRRTSFGPKNQGWKDSDEAIRYPDGSQVPNPIATVEENAFHCIALQRMAEILVALDEDARADEFLAKAAAMRRRWHDAFWMPEERAYAMALDPEKRQVASIGSNVGHALGAGIVPEEHARDVVERMLAPDMFSGWGVRTLSSLHPSYDPLAYHLGTVWPVENATFALGFKRYGFDDEVERLATAMLEAASHFQHCCLPEVLSGHSREERPTPLIYPGSCSPQAWSASAAIQLVQVFLGIYAYAPLNLLALVRPRLPEWLPTLTLRNVRLGEARATIRFERDRHGVAHHDVLGRVGSFHVMEAPPPNESGGPGFIDALKKLALDRAPGRRLRALRLALGTEA